MYDLLCLGRLKPVLRSLCRAVSCFSILQYKEQVRIQDVRLGKRRLNVDKIAVFKPLESCQKGKGLG